MDYARLVTLLLILTAVNCKRQKPGRVVLSGQNRVALCCSLRNKKPQKIRLLEPKRHFGQIGFNFDKKLNQSEYCICRLIDYSPPAYCHFKVTLF